MVIKTVARLALMGSLSVLPIATSAQVYKWIDDDGRTVVSDTPPPKGTKAEQLRKPIGASSEASGEIPGEKPESTPIPVDGKEKKAVPDQFSCAQARRMLQELESGRPLIVSNALGRPVEMSNEARTGETERLKELLKGCK